MTKVELKITGEIQKLHLEPGDKIIVSLDRHIPVEAAERLQEQLLEIFPEHESYILARGLRLSVEAA